MRSSSNIDEIVGVLMDCLAKPFQQPSGKLTKHVEIVEKLIMNGDIDFATRMKLNAQTFSMLSLYNVNDDHFDASRYLLISEKVRDEYKRSNKR